MTETRKLGPAGRVLLWVLGSALFLSIAILPYYMYFDFAGESTTRWTVAASTAFITLLLWLAVAYGPLKTPR
jgi:hypothetical protein